MENEYNAFIIEFNNSGEKLDPKIYRGYLESFIKSVSQIKDINTRINQEFEELESNSFKIHATNINLIYDKIHTFIGIINEAIVKKQYYNELEINLKDNNILLSERSTLSSLFINLKGKQITIKIIPVVDSNPSNKKSNSEQTKISGFIEVKEKVSNEMESLNLELKNTISNLQNENHRLKTELANLKINFEQFKRAVTKDPNLFDKIQQEKQAAIEKVNALSAEKAELKRELDKLKNNQQVNDLKENQVYSEKIQEDEHSENWEQKYTIELQEKEILKAELQKIKFENQDLQNKNQNLRNQIQETKTNIENLLKEIQSEKSALENKIENVILENNNLKGRNLSLEKENEQIKSEFNSLKIKYEQLNNSIDQNRNFQEQIALLQRQNSEISDQNRNFQEQIALLQRQNSEISDQNGGYKEQIAILQKSIQSMEQQIDTLEKKNKENKSRMDALQAENHKFEDEKKKLMEENQKLYLIIDEKEKEKEKLREKIEELKIKHKEIVDENIELDNENSDLQNQIEGLKDKIAVLEKQLMISKEVDYYVEFIKKMDMIINSNDYSKIYNESLINKEIFSILNKLCKYSSCAAHRVFVPDCRDCFERNRIKIVQDFFKDTIAEIIIASDIRTSDEPKISDAIKGDQHPPTECIESLNLDIEKKTSLQEEENLKASEVKSSENQLDFDKNIQSEENHPGKRESNVQNKYAESVNSVLQTTPDSQLRESDNQIKENRILGANLEANGNINQSDDGNYLNKQLKQEINNSREIELQIDPKKQYLDSEFKRIMKILVEKDYSLESAAKKTGKDIESIIRVLKLKNASSIFFAQGGINKSKKAEFKKWVDFEYKKIK